MKTINKLSYWILGLSLMLSLGLNGQPRPSREKLEAAKIGMISERLDLSPKKAQQFWPIYNEYMQKRKANFEAFRQIRRCHNPETATEKESQELLETRRKMKSTEMNLEQEYSEKMLTVISTKQLLSLQEAELEFRDKLLKHLQHRRKGDNKSGMPPHHGPKPIEGKK